MFPIFIPQSFRIPSYPVQFSSRLLAGNTCIHVSGWFVFVFSNQSRTLEFMFPVDLFLYFQISQVYIILVFRKNSVFWFLSSYFWVWWIPSSWPEIHILVSFTICFLLLDLLQFCHQLSPACKPCLFIFNSQWDECQPIQTKFI